jgi:hypothetical protein
MERRPVAPLVLLLLWVAPLTVAAAPLRVVWEERPSADERATERLENAPPAPPAAIGDAALADAPRRAGRLGAAELRKELLPSLSSLLLRVPTPAAADDIAAYGAAADDNMDILERDGVAPPWALLRSEAIALPPGLTCRHMIQYTIHQVLDPSHHSI